MDKPKVKSIVAALFVCLAVMGLFIGCKQNDAHKVNAEAKNESKQEIIDTKNKYDVNEEKMLLKEFLEQSQFKSYVPYEDSKLSKDKLDLCAEVYSSYKEFILSHKDRLLKDNENPFMTLLIDNNNLDKVSSGLFCCKINDNQYDLISLDFKDKSKIEAVHIGKGPTNSKEIIDADVKYEEFYKNRAKKIAETFKINLNEYYSASTPYDFAYWKADLFFLDYALKGALKNGGTAAMQEDTSNLIYLVKKDYSSGVILNSNENGMQYLHTFTINPKEQGEDRFKIVDTKREYCDPIITPNYYAELRT